MNNLKLASTFLLAAFAVSLSPAVGVAAIRNWIASSGDWSNYGNWTPFGVPVTGNSANISFADGIARTVNYDHTGPSEALNSLTLDLTGSVFQKTTLSMAANNLHTTNEYVGYYGRGAILQSGGTNTIDSSLYLGYEFGSKGEYTLSNNAVLVANTAYVGRDITLNNPQGGDGTLNIQDQAYASFGSLIISDSSIVDLDGGTLRFNLAGGLENVFGGGTIALARDATFGSDYAIDALFDYGGSFGIQIGSRSLTIEGIATANRSFNVFGGKLTTGIIRINNVGESYFGDGISVYYGGNVVANTVFMGTSSNTKNDVVIANEGSSWTSSDFDLGHHVSQDTLTISDNALVDIERLSIWNKGNVVLDGGTLRLGGYYPYGGVTKFVSGTLQLRGNRAISYFSSEIGQFLGSLPIVTLGKNLTIEGEATLYTEVSVDGGVLTVGKLDRAEFLDLRRGTLNITNQTVTIGAGGTFGTLDVAENMTVSSALGFTNAGLVTGDGKIGGTFSNAAGGELRAQSGRSLALTGSGNTNDGKIKLLGGELEFEGDLTNNAGAFISGNGSLLTGGLTNNGTMNFAGTGNIGGHVTNSAGGKIISGGGGATIFYDDVTNNGEIRTSTNGFTVFFGSLGGSGSFTGTGTVNFEGDFSPGNSPAAIQFAGDVVLGPDATLQIELGGTVAGSQYDQINVAGELTLGGTLEISLINGFTPSAGQTFDMLNWGSLAGAFSSVLLPSLDGLAWNTAQLSTGMLSVGQPGDFNANGVVDAADYAVWRKRNGSQTEFNTWRSHFGQPPGSGAGAIASAAVPESTSWVLLFAALLAMCSYRRRWHCNSIVRDML